MTDTDALHRPPPIGEWEAWKPWSDKIPAAVSMALECTEISSGHAVVVMNRSPWPLNPNGAVHGGLVVAAADQVGGLSAVTVVGPSGLPVTATLTAQFLRPALAPLTFAASVVKSGKSVLFVRVDVTDRAGALCATAIGTWSSLGKRRTTETAELP